MLPDDGLSWPKYVLTIFVYIISISSFNWPTISYYYLFYSFMRDLFLRALPVAQIIYSFEW